MTALKDISVEDLPRVAQDLVREIGLDATLKIIEHWGGGPLWIPDRMKQHNHIARLIGLEAAEKLSFIYAGDYLLVPRAAAALRLIRDREMLAKIENGHSAPQVARAYGTTDRNVRRIKERHRDAEDNRHPDLFD